MRGEPDTPDGSTTEVEVYVYDGAHVALRFIDGQLANRYLHGPAIDQILADEQVDSLSSPGEVLWPLTDHLGTVRDLAAYDDATSTTSIANHIAYDAFGRVTSQSNAAVDHLFGYTGREWDSAVDLQYNRARWYDPAIGRWLSEDPIGFAAGDANLGRYVGNQTTVSTDPSGLQSPQRPPGSNSPATAPNAPGVPGLYILNGLIQQYFGSPRDQLVGNLPPLNPTAIPPGSNTGWTVGTQQGNNATISVQAIGPGDLIGSSGMGPCIGVVVHPRTGPDSMIFATHFGPMENPLPTLNEYQHLFGPNAVVIVAGGDGSNPSNALLNQVLSQLSQFGARPFFHSGSEVYVDQNGTPYVFDRPGYSGGP